MRKIFMFGLLGIIALSISFVVASLRASGDKKEAQQAALSAKSASDLPEGQIKEYKVEPGDTFADIMSRMGVPYEDAHEILASSHKVFDFTKINAGKILKLVFVNEVLAAIEYPLNSDSVIHVKKENNTFEVAEESIPYVIEIATAKGVITNSLFTTAQDAGVDDKVTLRITDIFSSDVDFATDIREDDSFSVVYEKRSLDGKDAGAGRVFAVKFTNQGKIYIAYRYNNKFYDEEGKSFARQFLKSPLNYAYISSGFSYKRTNPVTKQITPHRAIDYAASEGTPVIATADGKVFLAGTKGGLGITVELKHGGYMTQYAHLSSVAKGVKNGADIFQGDTIGYVGSTGISTGPHLQYAMFKDGSPINPSDTDFPRGESIKDSDFNDFDAIKEKFRTLLN